MTVFLNWSACTFHCDPQDGSQTPEDREYIVNFKKRVIQFMQKWVMAVRHAAFDEPSVCDFIEELAAEVEADPELQEETSIIHNILTQMARYQDDRNQNAGQKWKLPPNGQPICLFSGNMTPSKTVIRPDDDSK